METGKKKRLGKEEAIKGVGCRGRRLQTELIHSLHGNGKVGGVPLLS